MSRWKYKVETVTVGENSQNVRKLTAGERRDFALASKKIAAGEMEKAQLPFVIAKFACIEPVLSDEDAMSMPPDLLDACVGKIMELSAIGGAKDKDDAEGPGEKKDDASLVPTTSSAAV